MRSPLLPAATLALALSACAPSLRPVTTVDPASAVVRARPDPAPDLAAPRPLPAVARRADDAPAAPAPAAAVEAPVSWDIEVEAYATHESVERYLGIFGGRARDYTASRLERGTRYEPMIRARLREAGMPEDLYYLAFVESGFDAHAYSRSAAVGMWQFMAPTARSVGLQVDWWVDDRRDPVRATDAAVRHLRDLRRQFDGSLYLAAAAYNGGSGRVSRGLGRHADEVAEAEGEDRFFALAETGYLHDETQQYVPQLIAVAMIGKEPARYGITLEPREPLAYDSVMVPAATSLAAVAAASESTVEEVVELNGRFLRGMTPPTGDEWEVRVPAGRGEGVAGRLAALPDSVRRAVRRVDGRKGETLAAIARRHGVTARQLEWYNPDVVRDRAGKLSRAQAVRVPSAAVVAVALDVADPSATSVRREPPTYVVSSGDSLDRIARRHGLTVSRLKALNGLKGDLIRPGQRLVVGG